MKSLRDIESESVALLEPLYGRNEARSIVRMLLEEYCSVASRDYVLSSDRKIDSSEPISCSFIPVARASRHASSFDSAMQMCLDWRPLQYTIGHANFYDQEFYVCEGVLIPRVETEQLVQMILREIDPRSSVLDIGTGSGCIALSLAKELREARVSACDISTEAAAIFEINRKQLDVDVSFFAIDILSESLSDKYDVIVSNPPYVLDSERAQMRSNVLDYEPELALFVRDSDPLCFYNRIAHLATEHLNNGGRLYFEINEQFGDQTKRMLEDLGFSQVEVCLDIFDKARMIKASWQNTNQ